MPCAKERNQHRRNFLSCYTIKSLTMPGRLLTSNAKVLKDDGSHLENRRLPASRW